MLTRDQILSRPPTIEQVPAPELGDGATLGVKLLSAAEFLRLSNVAKTKGDQAYACWLLACVCDAQGKAIFNPDDADAVGGLPFPLVNRLIEAAQRVNGTSEGAAKN